MLGWMAAAFSTAALAAEPEVPEAVVDAVDDLLERSRVELHTCLLASYDHLWDRGVESLVVLGAAQPGGHRDVTFVHLTKPEFVRCVQAAIGDVVLPPTLDLGGEVRIPVLLRPRVRFEAIGQPAPDPAFMADLEAIHTWRILKCWNSFQGRDGPTELDVVVTRTKAQRGAPLGKLRVRKRGSHKDEATQCAVRRLEARRVDPPAVKKLAFRLRMSAGMVHDTELRARMPWAYKEQPDAAPADVPRRREKEVRTVRRIDPTYPFGVETGDDRCVAHVFVDEAGHPYDVDVAACRDPFVQAARTALLQWRWAPVRDASNQPIRFYVKVGIRFRLKT